MSLLAFNDPFHDSSYCWLDATGRQHIEFERFTRYKLDRLSPLLGAILLEPDWTARMEAMQALGEVEGEFLAPLFRRLITAKARGGVDAESLTGALLRTLTADQAHTLPDELSGQTQLGDLHRFRLALLYFIRHALRPATRVAVLGHHHCHAAHAFYDSPFEQALSVTLDDSGYDSLDGPGEPRTEVYGGVFECEDWSVRAWAWAVRPAARRHTNGPLRACAGVGHGPHSLSPPPGPGRSSASNSARKAPSWPWLRWVTQRASGPPSPCHGSGSLTRRWPRPVTPRPTPPKSAPSAPRCAQSKTASI